MEENKEVPKLLLDESKQTSEKPEVLTDVKLTDEISLSNDLDVRVTKIHVKTLVNSAQKLLQGRSLSKNNILRIAFALMHVSDKIKNVKGFVKKQSLLAALDHLIQTDTHLSQNDKDMLLIMVYGVVSQAIDDRYIDDAEFRKQQCCVIL